MNILILGATGTFGQALVEKLILNSNYKLTLFSRHASETFKADNNITVIDGDATNTIELSNALVEQDVVFCAISGSQLPTIAQNLVNTMNKQGVSRLIFMGAVGIYNEIPVDLDDKDNLDNEPAQLPNRKAVDIVESSDLNYTVLRPGYLRDGEENDYVITTKGEPARGFISTIPSVVKLSIKLVNDETLYSRSSVSITRSMDDHLKNDTISVY